MKKSETARRTSWLPEEFSELERVEDRVVAAGLSLGRVGICVRAPGERTVTGSAAALGEVPVARAQFEVLERLATLEAIDAAGSAHTLRDRTGKAVGIVPHTAVFPESDAPEVWKFSRSSGVALHGEWTTACDRAWWELCERHRVLRAWYGDADVEAVAFDPASIGDVDSSGYRWRAARFVERASSAARVEVAGVFGFPTTTTAPMIAGFAGRADVDGAVAAAAVEALQQLAFLWGEEIPAVEPPSGPTPVHHVDALLWPGKHAAVEAWLARGHRAHGSGRRVPSLDAPDGFVDLTPSWLVGRACVVRAIAAAAEPLVFGESPAAAHLPRALRMHPIP